MKGSGVMGIEDSEVKNLGESDLGERCQDYLHVCRERPRFDNAYSHYRHNMIMMRNNLGVKHQHKAERSGHYTGIYNG